MHYLHCEVIDPTTYETQGLCDGLALRAHLRPDLKDYGTLRAQEDWKKHIKSMEQYKGGLGPQFSFVTVSVPECLPERMEVISCANNFAFLHDGRSFVFVCPNHSLTQARHDGYYWQVRCIRVHLRI